MHYLGTFEGERRAASRAYRAQGSLTQDIAGLLAAIAFSLAVGFIAIAALVPELPA